MKEGMKWGVIRTVTIIWSLPANASVYFFQTWTHFCSSNKAFLTIALGTIYSLTWCVFLIFAELSPCHSGPCLNVNLKIFSL